MHGNNHLYQVHFVVEKLLISKDFIEFILQKKLFIQNLESRIFI